MTSERADDVELIDTLPLVQAHVEVERYSDRILALTFEAPDLGTDVALLMSHAEARQLGSLLYRLGCE